MLGTLTSYTVWPVTLSTLCTVGSAFCTINSQPYCLLLLLVWYKLNYIDIINATILNLHSLKQNIVSNISFLCDMTWITRDAPASLRQNKYFGVFQLFTLPSAIAGSSLFAFSLSPTQLFTTVTLDCYYNINATESNQTQNALCTTHATCRSIPTSLDILVLYWMAVSTE